MPLGERIKELRLLRNMTQKELGNAIGLNAPRIGQYEVNFRKPKKDTLKAIADALYVSVNFFDNPEMKTLGDI